MLLYFLCNLFIIYLFTNLINKILRIVLILFIDLHTLNLTILTSTLNLVNVIFNVSIDIDVISKDNIINMLKIYITYVQ